MKLIGKGGCRPMDGKDQYHCRKWQLWQFVDDNGRKQKTRNFEGTMKQAKQALAEFQTELENSIPNTDLFSAYCDKWLQWREGLADIGETTSGRDRSNVTALCREFGNDRMDAITPGRVKDGMLAIRNGNNAKHRELSGTYMHKLHSIMRLIMQSAEDDGAIQSNPLAKVHAPKRDTKTKTALTREEWEHALDTLDSMPQDGRTVACYIMLMLGLRRAEACALAVEDIDYSNNLVHVHQAYKENIDVIGSTKSKAGVRDLPMPSRLREYLLRWDRLRLEKYGHTQTVCCSTSGDFLYPQNLARWWWHHREEIGCADMTLHELRHTNLTIMAGVFGSPFHLMRWAGWSSVDPARVYVHEDLSGLVAAVKGM